MNLLDELKLRCYETFDGDYLESVLTLFDTITTESINDDVECVFQILTEAGEDINDLSDDWYLEASDDLGPVQKALLKRRVIKAFPKGAMKDLGGDKMRYTDTNGKTFTIHFDLDNMGSRASAENIYIHWDKVIRSDSSLRSTLLHEINHAEKDFPNGRYSVKNVSKDHRKDLRAEGRMDYSKKELEQAADSVIKKYQKVDDAKNKAVAEMKRRYPRVPEKVIRSICESRYSLKKEMIRVKTDLDPELRHKLDVAKNREKMSKEKIDKSAVKSDAELRVFFKKLLDSHKGENYNDHLNVRELMADNHAAAKNGVANAIANLTTTYSDAIDDYKRYGKNGKLFDQYNEYKIRIEALRKAKKQI